MTTNTILTADWLMTQITARREQIAQEVTAIESGMAPLKAQLQEQLIKLEGNLSSLRAEDKRLEKTLNNLTRTKTNGKAPQTAGEALSEEPITLDDSETGKVVEACYSLFQDSGKASLRSPDLLKAARAEVKGLTQEKLVAILADSKRFIQKERGWWGYKPTKVVQSGSETSTPVKSRVAVAAE